jgi:radical SAM protein with 4Fe4S-binding SPASM domain
MRQAGSALFTGLLTRWREMPKWLLSSGFKCLPGAAGSLGMGCIGFPCHPVWEMTTACNLKCIHCHTSGGERASDELDTDEAKNMLAELARVKQFRMMAFTGGEPLMRPDIHELLDFARTLGFTNTLATNATMIDDAAARGLKRRGVVIAAVSLDGCTAALHDSLRGTPGAFESAVEGMRALNRAGILLHINITVMEYNLKEMAGLMDLVDELRAGILLMYQLIPVGRGRGLGAAVLDLGENERLIRFMASAQRSSRAVIEPVAGPQYWPYLLQRAHMDRGPALRFSEKVFHGCAAGRGFIYIKPNGDVWPCPFIEVSCGNIRTVGLGEIWHTSAVLDDLRHREDRLKGRCGTCSYRRLCGGCRGRAWALTGDYLAEDPSCFFHMKHDNGGEA